MIGKTVSHFKILEKLGEGGMGEVYLTNDTDLDRKVALKFLPLHYTNDKEINERFKREAKAAAKLNHPNIITVYEIGEYEAQSYIAMEYVKGHSLREEIKKGSMPVDFVVDIATQLCEGLSKAHKAEIVHRDIKPENIFIDEDGRVKILDFGIAQVKTATRLTKEASTIGTFKYMSPEQYQNKEVDHRTDIWSFGVVLFEMLTGQLPFQGDYEASVIYSVVNEEPESIESLREDVPKNLEQIVIKSLEKDPAMRHQSMQEVLKELKKPIVTTSVLKKQEKSIAVLPFRNMSADPEQEYFCEGMSEEIINALAHIEDLKVIARTSAFAFKGKHEDAREIGRKLGVESLLEGSVRKAGNRVRITAQLINVDDGSHLWSERYDRELQDVFDIQDEISLTIVEKLKVELLGDEKAVISKRTTEDLDVYNLYLLGSYHLNRATREDMKKSLQYFEETIAHDPNYAPGHAGLAMAYGRAVIDLGMLSLQDGIPLAKAAAEKALVLDPDNALAHRGLATVAAFFERNWSRVEYHSKRAIESHPNNVDVRAPYALLLSAAGRHEEAIREITRAVELDPVSALMAGDAGFYNYLARNFDTARTYCERSLTLDPNFDWARLVMSMVDIQQGKFDHAIVLLEKVETVAYYSGGYLGYAYAAAGRTNEAYRVLCDLNEIHERGEGSAYGPALVHLGLGEKKDALDCLEKACDESPAFLLTTWLKSDPIWDPLRSDPRFQNLLRRMNFPE